MEEESERASSELQSPIDGLNSKSSDYESVSDTFYSTLQSHHLHERANNIDGDLIEEAVVITESSTSIQVESGIKEEDDDEYSFTSATANEQENQDSNNNVNIGDSESVLFNGQSNIPTLVKMADVEPDEITINTVDITAQDSKSFRRPVTVISESSVATKFGEESMTLPLHIDTNNASRSSTITTPPSGTDERVETPTTPPIRTDSINNSATKQDQLLEALLSGQIDKSNICGLINGGDELSTNRRKAYLKTFSFSPPLLKSLRTFLATFNLGGETQQQDRILSEFSQRYHDCTKEFPFDVCYQLVYSCILLNTDLHMPNNPRKMTRLQYSDNTISSIASAFERSDEEIKQEYPQLEAMLGVIYAEIMNDPIMQPPKSETEDAHMESSPGSFVRSILRNMTIRRKPSQSSSIKSDDSSFMIPEPFKEGLLIRKHVMDSFEKRTFDRKWYHCYCRIVASDLLIFNLPSPEFVRNNTDNLDFRERLHNEASNLLFHIPLRHVIATQLPYGAYTPDRPYVFQILLPFGGIYLFQALNETVANEWCVVINYWAAMESREPLSSGVGLWYGIERDWLLDFIPNPDSNEEPRKFDRINDNSVATFHVPLLPFVPTSMASQVEEVTLKSSVTSVGGVNEISRLYNPIKPLGFNKKKLANRMDKYKMWSKRLENLCVDVERMVFERELMRCVGIGRGVVDATAQDFIPTFPTQTFTIAGDVLADTSSDGGDYLKSKLVKALTSNQSIYSMAETSGGDWRPEKAATYSLVPEGMLTVLNHEKLAIHKVPEKKSNDQKSRRNTSFTLTIPCPVNLEIHVPSLPDSVFKATVNPEMNMPNFSSINKKLALRMDKNWKDKFHFVCSEIVKAFHYTQALKLGIEIQQPLVNLNQSTVNLGDLAAKSTESLILNRRKTKLTKKSPLELSKSNSSLSNISRGRSSFRFSISPLRNKSAHTLTAQNSGSSGSGIFNAPPIGSDESQTHEETDIRHLSAVSGKMKELMSLEYGIGIAPLNIRE